MLGQGGAMSVQLERHMQAHPDNSGALHKLYLRILALELLAV